MQKLFFFLALKECLHLQRSLIDLVAGKAGQRRNLLDRILHPQALKELFQQQTLCGHARDLLLLFGSRELRTALFALFTGHVQLIFFYKKDRILAFTRSVMASAAKKDQNPALVLYRMEKMMLPVSSLPRLKESKLNALIG